MQRRISEFWLASVRAASFSTQPLTSFGRRRSRAATSGDEPLKIGSLKEIFVECIQATSPYSTDRWRDTLDRQRKHGADVPEFEVARVSVRQDAFNKK
jgi:hypothetical protein